MKPGFLFALVLILIASGLYIWRRMAGHVDLAAMTLSVLFAGLEPSLIKQERLSQTGALAAPVALMAKGRLYDEDEKVEGHLTRLR